MRLDVPAIPKHPDWHERGEYARIEESLFGVMFGSRALSPFLLPE
jgi:hypothetical protein